MSDQGKSPEQLAFEKWQREEPFREHDRQTDAALKILPAWFVPRMMWDVWSFGLLLTTGQVLCITNIAEVRQAENGTVWIDAMMSDNREMSPSPWPVPGKPVYAPTSRLMVSINAAHVVAAFELADT